MGPKFCTADCCCLVFKVIIYIAGTTCFFLHVSDSWSKYTSGSTTFTSTYVAEKDLLVPSIGLCSRTAFNSSQLRLLNTSSEFFNYLSVSQETWKFFDHGTELKESWDTAAISMNDFLNLTFRGKANGYGELLLDRSNLSTFNSFVYGKCSRITDLPINFSTTSDLLKIKIDMSTFGVGVGGLAEIDVWFSSPGSDIFGTVGMFVGDISMFTTNPGNVYAFYISKRTTKFNPSDKFNCSTEETFSNYSRCLRGYVTKKLVGERETGLPCYFPYFNQFITHEEKPCQTLDQLHAMNGLIYATSDKFANSHVTGCQEPCTKEKFTINMRSVPASEAMRKAKELQLTISFEDIRVEKLVEYVLFDFNAIIGTVGGSLGLFLGLSFADLTIRIFSGAAKWIAQRCKNSREANSAQRIKCGLSNKGDH